MSFGLERLQAKWVPVRVKKTRQNKGPELGSDSIRNRALADESWEIFQCR